MTAFLTAASLLLLAQLPAAQPDAARSRSKPAAKQDGKPKAPAASKTQAKPKAPSPRLVLHNGNGQYPVAVVRDPKLYQAFEKLKDQAELKKFLSAATARGDWVTIPSGTPVNRLGQQDLKGEVFGRITQVEIAGGPRKGFQGWSAADNVLTPAEALAARRQAELKTTLAKKKQREAKRTARHRAQKLQEAEQVRAARDRAAKMAPILGQQQAQQQRMLQMEAMQAQASMRRAQALGRFVPAAAYQAGVPMVANPNGGAAYGSPY